MRPSSALLLIAAPALAAVHVPLQKRAHKELTATDYQLMRSHVIGKYAGPHSAKTRRQSTTTSTVSLSNHNLDSSYSAQLSIGTPPVNFDVILDTGSSDLWLAGTECTECSGMPLWDHSASSTFQSLGNSVKIRYGSGTALGTVGADTVSMGAFSVPNQELAVISSLDAGLVVDGVSGLMGLGFKSIASTDALPWWEALVQGNVWTQPLMSFYFTRFINDASASAVEPGGVFTMGGTNTSFYTGDVDFVDLPTGVNGGFWLLPVDTVTTNGQLLQISTSGNTVLGAIDTGTTLIGVPTEAVSEVYATIPGSQAGSGQWEGFMLYPCSTKVNMQINFGSQSWPVSNSDFQLARVTSSLCAGAVFELNTGGGAGQPQWVIGDTFLKNVYSVFRFNPPSVGFATLASNGDGAGSVVAGSGSNAAGPRAARAPLLVGALAAVAAFAALS